ncbi:hypothetical protein N0V85_004999 [Neurospora sp. IMI 360204]|nr:hypothetical protein N0V85_004999 [Neurospora sp. IMI 360204]
MTIDNPLPLTLLRGQQHHTLTNNKNGNNENNDEEVIVAILLSTVVIVATVMVVMIVETVEETAAIPEISPNTSTNPSNDTSGQVTAGVTGRQEVWQTIHAALEILWHQAQEDAAAAAQNGDGTLAAASDYEGEGGSRGDVDEDEEDENDRAIALETAQTILSAAEITLPTGDLAQGGAYDSLGNYYSLPEHIVSDPTNLSTSRPASEAASEYGDEDEENGYADTKGTMSVTDGEIMTEGDGQDGALESGDEVYSSERHRREEKGKAVVNVKDLITVRARLSDGSKDVIVQVDKGDLVRVLGRKVAEKAKLSSDKKVRIVYMGKVLKETSTLPDQGWKQGNIVNALVFNR